jgi:hypothetical protein
VKRYEGEEAVEALRQRMRQPASQRRCRRRGPSAERTNAEMKEQRGLRQLRRSGQARAQAQVGLVALTMNGLRLQKPCLERDGKPPGSPCSQEG